MSFFVWPRGLGAAFAGRFARVLAQVLGAAALVLAGALPAAAELVQITAEGVEARDDGTAAENGPIQPLSPDRVRPRINVRDDLTSGVFPYPEINLPPIFDASDAFRGVVVVEMFIPGLGSGLCTGTVINQRTVLIAAHCVQNLADDAGVADGVLQPFVYFAPDALADFFSFNGVAGTSHIVHAAYDRNAFFLGNDIALVSLSQPISRSTRPGLVNGVPYITLATADPALFETLTLVGYGQAGVGSDPGVAFDLKRRVATNQVDYVGPSNDVLGGGGTGQMIFTDFADPLDIAGTDYFCFFFWGAPSCTVTPTEGSTDNGDSGGPIFVSNGAGGYTQVGVTSGGANACGGPQGGYCDVAFWTSVAAYNSWIQANSPLREVSAVAGDALWSNAAHWSEGAVPDNFKTPVGSITDFTNTANYYNVTLSAAGTTTLDDAREIDELAIIGASSMLTITPTGNLFVWSQTSVGAGVLRVDGTLDTEYVDLFGGRIQGIGSIVSAADFFGNFGGTLAPGNSIGTLTIVGDYVQGVSGLLEIELTNGASDLLAVTGNASLAGTVSFAPFGPSPLEGQTYTFLTTGGTVSGTFSAVQDLLPGGLFPYVTYGSNFVNVTVRSLCSFATGPLQTPVCGALSDNAVETDPDMIPAIAQLQALAIADEDAFRSALEALNPTRVHAQTIVGLTTGDLLRNQFGRRSHDLLGGSTASVAQRDLAGAQLAAVSPSADMLASAAAAAIDGADGGGGSIDLPNGHALFFAADVAITETDQPAGIGEDDADVVALTAGLDHNDGRGMIYGAALSYLQANVSQNYGFGGNTASDGVAISGYGNLHHGLMYVDAFLSYAWHDFETERRLLVGPSMLTTAEGSTDASQILAGATLGYGLNTSARMSLGAVAGLHYINLDIDGYTETGGPLAAVIPSRTIDSLKGQLGGEMSFQLEPGNETLVPILRVVWNHEFMDDALLIQSGFAGAPATTFATPGPDLGTDWATVGFGLSGKVSDGTSFYFRYQHDFGRDGQENQEISAAARMAF